MPNGKQKLLADVDIAVIGGGVVGCAVTRRMTLAGASVALVEKSGDILAGASKGNSAILHTGFDAPPETLEWQCVQDGHKEYLKIYKDFKLPLLKTGAMVVAWNAEQEAKFEEILQKGYKNKVSDLKLLNKDEVLRREPKLNNNLHAGILIPQEYLIDPWSSPLAYITQAVDNGAKTIFNAQITDGNFDGKTWTLQCKRGTIKARQVINCAGLYGDLLDKDVLGKSEFIIKPRKGQFVVFDKAANALLKSVILPVPTKRTKGIVIFPTVFGNLAVGPTAEEQESRSDASVDKTFLKELHAQAVDKIPELKNIPVTATYAGIRSASDEAYYRVQHDTDKNWITLGGIRSTGLTSSLGLAQHVQRLLQSQGIKFKSIINPSVPTMPNLAESFERDYQSPGYDEIVCHCEMTTKREIENTFKSSVPPGSLSGLKRRTRATMGRCQGFCCSARLDELSKNKIDQPFGIGDVK